MHRSAAVYALTLATSALAVGCGGSGSATDTTVSSENVNLRRVDALCAARMASMQQTVGRAREVLKGVAHVRRVEGNPVATAVALYDRAQAPLEAFAKESGGGNHAPAEWRTKLLDLAGNLTVPFGSPEEVKAEYESLTKLAGEVDAAAVAAGLPHCKAG